MTDETVFVPEEPVVPEKYVEEPVVPEIHEEPRYLPPVPKPFELPSLTAITDEVDLDYDAIYPMALDENQNPVWSKEQLAEIEAANKPIFAQLARNERDAKLAQYDKDVAITTRAIRLTGPSGDVSKLYEYMDKLDAYAILLQNVPSQPGFPEVIEWPEAPVLETE